MDTAEETRKGSSPFLEYLRGKLAPAPVQIALGFIVILAVMSFIEFAGPAILDNDGYYHIRWAALLREHAPGLPPFKALPLTTLNERDYVDHHFLFHILLTPFTLIDMRTGAKLAAALFSSLGLGSLFALLVSYRVKYRWAWLVPLIASSEPFLYRMSMTRAPALSIAFLGLGAYLILHRKHLLLGVLSFAFVWLYSLFPLIAAMALAHAAAVYLSEQRLEWRAVAATLIGIAAGMTINPYFPKNVALFWAHLWMKTTSDYPVPVGVEWYPYDTWVILGGSALAFAIFFIALAAFDWREREVKAIFFLLISIMFLLMAMKSRRFIEYWPPFAVVFGAFALAPLIERIKWSSLSRTRDQVIAATASAVGLLVLVIAIETTILQARTDVASEADPFAYQGAGEWIRSNTAPGSMIFNTDWDDFPMLFYYSPENAYAAGLDPTYLYDADAELWKHYERITLGKEKNPAPVIRDRFKAEYVFTDNGHEAFLEVAERSGDFEIVYKDQDTTLLRIRAMEETAPPQ
jgi:asparagine N-glycosylation enzyme membrane subunit Stt3